LGWFLDFVGVCVLSSVRDVDQFGFYLFFHLVMIIAVVTSIAFDAVKSHKLALVAFLAAGFVFIVDTLSFAIPTTKAVKSGNFYNAAALAAAGNIFLVFPYIAWIIVFGSDEQSPVTQLASTGTADLGINMSGFQLPSFKKGAAANGQENVALQPDYQQQQYQQQQYVAPVTPSTYVAVTPTTPVAIVKSPEAALTAASPVTLVAAEGSAAGEVVCRAEALYGYKANEKDPSEISFAKGDLFEVIDNKGKWWKARLTKPDGSVVTGSIPSNYVKVVD
ncbi:Transmembrane osmosensor, partial [Blyttiomyces sp. JEL0837]